MKEVHIFYHLFMINNWDDVLKKTINSLIESELYDYFTSINIGCVF